jgi:S1-C subfamily serine protease
MKTVACLLILHAFTATGAGGAPAPTIPPAVLQAQSERIAVIARAKEAVLAIFSADGGGGGSGVVISSDGYALTNFHVAQPCGAAMKCGLPDGKIYDAVVVGLDPTGDVALVKLFGRDHFPTATLGDSDALEQGDWVYVMGNPFLLSTDFQPTVTYGILSGVHRYQYPSGTLLEYTDCLQTDASINPGNSGGPLFDSQGRLIGINGRASFEKRGRVNVGVGYSISINQIKNFLGALHSGRLVDHATLGARVGFDADSRVVVTDILESSDAYRRGLRYGDEIVSFAGHSIDTPNTFKNVLGIFPKGWRVPLSFRREGKRHDVLVRLTGVHREEELIAKATERPPEMPQPKPKAKKKGAPSKKLEPPKHPGEIPVPQDIPLQAKAKKEAELPAVVKQHYEVKRGYANYYFNKLERDRVWKAFAARGNFQSLSGLWTIAARPAGSNNALELRLNDAEATLLSGTSQWKWQVGREGEAQLEPAGSGGLLLALHLWRRLMVEGPQHYGEVHYQATQPLPGHAGLVDVLVGFDSGVECRFYFDPREGFLVALELYPGSDTDPCELELADYREVDGRWLPGRLEVRCGDEHFGTFHLESFKLEKSITP